MKAFKNILTTTIGAVLIGSASIAPDFAIGANTVNPKSSYRIAVAPAQSDHDADTPNGYAQLGIAKINGSRFAVYGLQNGARLDDSAGQGRGFAEVFDSAGHLMRRFTFRENLNSPPQITEYVSMPDR
jgi:hypothetical protein